MTPEQVSELFNQTASLASALVLPVIAVVAAYFATGLIPEGLPKRAAGFVLRLLKRSPQPAPGFDISEAYAALLVLESHADNRNECYQRGVRLIRDHFLAEPCEDESV